MCIQNILCINAFCSSNFIFVAETLCKEVCSRSCINREQPTKNSKRQMRDNYKKKPSRASNVRPHSPGIRVKAISCDSSPITDWHYSSQTESTFS